MPKKARTEPTSRMLYQGVSVFGSFPPLTVVVGVVEVVDPATVVEVVDDVDAVVEVDDEPGDVVKVVDDPDPVVVDVDDPAEVVEVDDDPEPVVVEVDDPDPVVVEVDDEVDVVDVVVTVAQIPLVMVLVSRMTAPLRAKSCPCTVAPVLAVMDVKAKMWPTK